jgi:hypothetical protein
MAHGRRIGISQKLNVIYIKYLDAWQKDFLPAGKNGGQAPGRLRIAADFIFDIS